MQGKVWFTYMLANGYRGWLYVGVTNDLGRRVAEHKAGVADSYTAEHGVDRLVWFEPHDYVDKAILREKRIKRWRREWKFALVEETNSPMAGIASRRAPGSPFGRPGGELKLGCVPDLRPGCAGASSG